jgi:hypothetical protein
MFQGVVIASSIRPRPTFQGNGRDISHTYGMLACAAIAEL